MRYAVLEQTLESLKEVDPRSAAEHAYALAALHQRDGNNAEAVHFGREAIALFDKCSMQTMEDCAARGVIIEGIAIPDIIHQDVVRNRLQPLVL